MTTQCVDIKENTLNAIDKAFQDGRITDLQRQKARKIAVNSIFDMSIKVAENEEVVVEEGFDELIIQKVRDEYPDSQQRGIFE